MAEKTILITEHDGTYQLHNNGISEFALIGMLECILLDLKSAGRRASSTGREESPAERTETDNRQPAEPTDSPQPLRGTEEKAVTEIIETPQATESIAPKREAAQPPPTPDVRARISNAVRAIHGLGGQIEDTDLNNLTEEELQTELEELTSQYKRLKNTKGKGK